MIETASPEGCTLSPDDLSFLQALAHILGASIARRRVLDQQHAARTEAERSLAILGTVLTASSLGIAFLDPALRFVRVNETLAALDGRPVEAHLGRTVREVLGGAAAELEARLRRVLETRTPITGLEFQDPPDAPPAQARSFLANLVPVVTAAGELLGIGTVIVEITARKRIEAALRASEAEAQRAARMREEILAVVSHDLKNPLGAIHLAATLLLEKPEPHARKHLEVIYRAASRMDDLIGDLLDMASIQAGRLAVDRAPHDAEALVREVVETHEPMALEKGVRLERSPTRLGAVQVACDRRRVLQVFGNLIGNAIKFCRPGDTITIRAAPAGDVVRFAIADTGPGIGDKELPHIFEPYWSAKKHAAKGTGLGLFISRGIVEAHGGQLTVESAAGEGATFTFTLPVG